MPNQFGDLNGVSQEGMEYNLCLTETATRFTPMRFVSARAFGYNVEKREIDCATWLTTCERCAVGTFVFRGLKLRNASTDNVYNGVAAR